MKKIVKVFLLILVLSNYIYFNNAYGATINAASCSYSDVQSAINSANNDDIVEIPNGVCTWTSTITIDKSIKLKGSGSYAISDDHQDIGNWPLTITLSNVQSGIEITCSTDETVEVSGIHFNGGCGGGASSYGAIRITSRNSSSNIRIHDCKFTLTYGNSVAHISSGLGGLVDHCYMYDSGCGSANAIFVMDQRNSTFGDWIFTQEIGWGGAKFLFVEDCTFYTGGCSSTGATVAIDAQAGGKYVFRHNYVYDAFVLWHDTGTGAPQRGGYAFEVYDNEFYWHIPDNRIDKAIYHRDGVAYIYNNKFTNFQSAVQFRNYRVNASYGRFGICDNTNNWDGDSSNPDGYPCLDQPGVGKCNSIDISSPGFSCEPEPTYIWNNTRVHTSYVDNRNPSHIFENSSYNVCDDTSCAPEGYTAFPYPHSLRGQVNAFTTPQNLRIVDIQN